LPPDARELRLALLNLRATVAAGRPLRWTRRADWSRRGVAVPLPRPGGRRRVATESWTSSAV